MKIVGIIAEYNPFHNGHLYQINYAKNVLKADAIVVVMSGDFVQRGEPALLNKYTRAQMALQNGVDLVLEMPVAGATGSAEFFANAGIQPFIKSGIVTDVIFGCEDESPLLFKNVAKILLEEPKIFRETLSAQLRDGTPFAKARANAVCAAWENESERVVLSHFLASPNNILGIEYTKAIIQANTDIEIHPLTRIGVSHDDLKFNGLYASASFIRETLLAEGASENDVFSYVPENCLDILKDALEKKLPIEADDLSLILHNELYKIPSLSDILDCNEDIANRIQKELDLYTSFSEFADLLKTKNVNHARLRRVLTHVCLGLNKEIQNALKGCEYCPYFHVMGFTKHGAGLLNDIKKNSDRPLFTSPNEVKEGLNRNQKVLFEKDLYASNLYRMLMTNKSEESYPTEYTRKFVPYEDVDFLAINKS